MWRWQSGECKVLQGHKEQVRCFSLLSNSPTDTRLLSWSFDGTVKVRHTQTHTHRLKIHLTTAWNEMKNDPSLFYLLTTRCGTWKVERCCRTSRLIKEPFCPVMSRQTDASSPPPLLTRLRRLNTYTHTYSLDETYLFVLPVTTWPITHQRLPSNLLRNSLLTAHAHECVAVGDIWYLWLDREGPWRLACSRLPWAWWVSCGSVCPFTHTSSDYLVWPQLVDLLTH